MPSTFLGITHSPRSLGRVFQAKGAGAFLRASGHPGSALSALARYLPAHVRVRSISAPNEPRRASRHPSNPRLTFSKLHVTKHSVPKS